MDQEIGTPQQANKIESLKNFIFQNKNKILIGLLVGFVILLAFSFAFVKQKESQQQSSNLTPTTTSQNLNQTNSSFNPLINNKEIDHIKDEFKKQYQKAGKVFPEKTKYNFKYKLSDSLKKQSFHFPVEQVIASSCLTTSAPSIVTAYLLKNHYILDDAKTLAKTYNLDFDPSSIPEDGGAYKYLFTDPSSKSFLTISEPSGTYVFHQAFSTAATGDIGKTQAIAIGEKTLTDHKLSKDVVFKSVVEDAHMMGEKRYQVFYSRTLGAYPVTDFSAISSIGAINSVCSIYSSSKMNTLEVHVIQDGKIEKIISNTREILKTYSFASESLETSQKEYSESLPIDPIVIGSAKVGEEVNLEESTIVWYDLGEIYPQVAYVPMYLTSGRTTSGARVLTLFPVVSKAEIDKTEIGKELGSENALQIKEYNPNPPPVSKGPPGCYGNQIDYEVWCSLGGDAKICTYAIGIEATDDPFGVCKKGCEDIKSEIITVTKDQDPCFEFWKKYFPKYTKNLYLDDRWKGYSGNVSCRIQGCPC